MGHNPTVGIRDFSGEMNFDPEKLEAGSFRLVVKAASLSVQDDISDKDRREIERLMNQEVLETAKFPEIRYEASDISVTRISENALFGCAQRRAYPARGNSAPADQCTSRVIGEYAYGPPAISRWIRRITTSSWSPLLEACSKSKTS